MLLSYYRGCWHEISRSFFSSYVIIFTSEITLQPINRYQPTNLFCFPHSRNITGSNFRPLSKIPHCWLKSLDLISVPVWLVVLSDQLRIFGLVSLYLTNYLILRKLILKRQLTFRIWHFFTKYIILSNNYFNL